MNIASNVSVNASAAGAPLSQKAGATERTKQDTSAQQRTEQTDLKAEEASGIGTTEEDQETSERDADGRRLWEAGPDANEEATESIETKSPKLAKDPTGEMGNSLDLTG
ncbi:MAG: hypothetical protein RH917_07575 [Lacipirellulaceae bacterium]